MFTVVIVLLVAGTVGALLMPWSYEIARSLWPGPSVKGPADFYAQAFQTLTCFAVLAGIALLASVVSFLLSLRIEWTAGQWLSGTPLVCAGVVVALRLARR